MSLPLWNFFEWSHPPYLLVMNFWFSFSYGKELEKAMAPHSSTLAWKIPWMEEPGGPQSMGSPRVGHDWVISFSLLTFTHWRRKWQPTPVFLPGESQGRRSLAGCCLWGRTESDTTERLSSSSSSSSTHLLEWLKSKALASSNVGKDVVQQDLSFFAHWNAKWYNYFGR